MKSSSQNNFQEDTFQEDINEKLHIWELNTTGESDSYLNLNVYHDLNTNDKDCIPVEEVPLHKTGVLLYDGAIRLQGKRFTCSVTEPQRDPFKYFLYLAFGVIKALSSGCLITTMMVLCYLSFCVKRSGTWIVSSQHTSWGIR